MRTIHLLKFGEVLESSKEDNSKILVRASWLKSENIVTNEINLNNTKHLTITDKYSYNGQLSIVQTYKNSNGGKTTKVWVPEVEDLLAEDWLDMSEWDTSELN